MLCSFIRTLTVGPGIAPGQRLALRRAGRGLMEAYSPPITAGEEFHLALNRQRQYSEGCAEGEVGHCYCS